MTVRACFTGFLLYLVAFKFAAIRLLDRDTDGCTRNPGRGYLNNRRAFAGIRRQSEVHLIAVHRAGPADGAYHFRRFSIHRYLERRVDDRRSIGRERLPWIDSRTRRTESGGKKR